MSEWGEGVINNNIGWGQGANNNIGWGSIYGNSYSGDTALLNYFFKRFPITTGAAYSLRQLNDSITNVVRVRRSSDNLESNFTENEINNGSLAVFCGAGNGFVTTWYDQSGNNANVIQTTAANQPSIVLNGLVNLENGKPAIAFDGVNDFLSFNGEVLNKGSFLAFAVIKNIKTSGFGRIFDQSNVNGGALLSSGGSQDLFGITSVGNINISRATPVFTQSLRIGQMLSGKSKTRINAANEINNTTTFTMSGNTGIAFVIGENSPTSANAFQGSMQEIVIYTTDNDANIAVIETQINNNYSIY